MSKTSTTITDRPRLIVAIGTSAGGLRALEQFFEAMPGQSGTAFVVVSHLAPDQNSFLQELLQRHTEMPVQQVLEDTVLLPDRVFLMPPGRNLRLQADHLRPVIQPREQRHQQVHWAINLFFESVAQDYRERAIGVILSGSGSDGARGLARIVAMGGMAFVQSPTTAEFAGMPNSAIATGVANQVDAPAGLARMVYAIAQAEETVAAEPPSAATTVPTISREDELDQALQILSDHEDVDFTLYKPTTLKRRLQRRIALSGVSSFRAYLDWLQTSAEERDRLRQSLLISTTSFFRDREAWRYLEQQIIPELIENATPHQQLRIWVTACSTGEEAYSLAMLLDEAIGATRKPLALKIFATDVDSRLIETASAGLFPPSIAQHIKLDRLRRYFTQEEDGFRVTPYLRDYLVFAPHNLAKNAPFSRMDLVSCRNVLIYLQPPLQSQILRALHFALRPSGILFLGAAETLGDVADEFETLTPTWKFFRKRRNVRLSLEPPTRTPQMKPVVPRIVSSTYQTGDSLSEAILEATYAIRKAVCLVTNPQNQLLHVIGDSQRVLMPPRGRVSADLVSMLRSPLRLPISTALHRVKQTQTAVTYTDVRVETAAAVISYTLRADYHQRSASEEPLLLLVLEETDITPAIAPQSFEADSASQQRILELERNLQQTQENLQASIETLEASNEEQQATNEELLASNEELQSTNEELHSVNEELQRVNVAYQAKIQELTELNQDIDNLLRSTEIGVIFLDQNLRIRKFTPSATAVIQLSPYDINRAIENFRPNTDHPDRVFDDLRQVLTTATPLEREIVLTATGDDYLMRIHPYRRDDGSLDGLVLTFVNINPLKAFQRQIEQQNAELEYLYTTLPAGLGLIDEDFRFVRINALLAEINGLPAAAQLGCSLREVLPNLADRLEPLYQHVFETGEPLENIEIHGSTPAHPDEARDWLASYHLIAMPDGRRLVGAVVRDITELKTAQRELQALNTQLEQRVRDRTAELEQSQAQLRNNQRQLSTLLNNSPDIITRFGPDLRRTFTNDALAQITQIPVSHLVGSRVTDSLSPENAAQFEANLQRVFATGEPQVWEHQRQVQGQPHWFEMRLIPEFDDQGRVASVLNLSRDISARRQAEAAQRQSENRLRLFVEHSPAAIAMLDRQLRYIAVSRRWYSDYNLEEPDILGRSHYEIFPETPASWRQVHQRCLAGAIERCEAEPFVRASGETQWVRWEVHPWREADDSPGGIIMFTEVITEQVRAQQALQASESRFRQLAENIQEVFFLLTIDARTMLYVSPAYEQIWGRTCDSLYAQPTDWINAIHGADQPRVQAAMARQLQDYSDFAEDYRIVRPDGEQRWIRAKSTVVRDEAGQPVRIAGIAEDITDDKAMAAQQRFVQQVADASPNVLYIYDLSQHRFTYLNRVTVRILGYSLAAIQAMTLPQLRNHLHPEDYAAFGDHLVRLQAADGDDIYTLEFRVRNQDGEWIWLLSRDAVFQRDSEGQVQQIVGAAQDITARKRDRQQLQEALSAQEMLLREVHHRVKNNLNVIYSLLNMQVQSFQDEQLRSALMDSQRRIQSMSLIHEQLYHSAHFSRVEFSQYLERLVRNIAASSNPDPMRVQARLNVDPVTIDLQTAIPLGLIVNELTSNAFKHAFPEGRSGTVTLDLTQTATGEIRLVVADDGVGLAVEDWRSLPSLGMRLVQILSQQLRATLEVQRQNGTCFTLTFRLGSPETA